jgi:hypothetical protein
MFQPPVKQQPLHGLRIAIRAFRKGDVVSAEKIAMGLMKKDASTRVEAMALRSEIYYRTRNVEGLEGLLREDSLFRKDRRWKIMWARLMSLKGDKVAAEKVYNTLLSHDIPGPVYRIAAFELAKIMDASGRYDEAWALGTQAHRRTTKAYPLDAMSEALRVTAMVSDEERVKIFRASQTLDKTAFIHGLPRSGTSLLEQMLDLHSHIKGVGETSMTGRMGDRIAAEGGGWPVGVLRVKESLLNSLQEEYRQQVRDFHAVPDHIWTVDKTVFPMIQPLVVAVTLPGARVIRIVRSAKDNAVSLFLNNMDPSWGFTASLDSIYSFIEAERTYVPEIYRKMGVDCLSVKYEQLVASPLTEMQRILSFLGLPFEEACLSPQKNKRVVHTLSHDQVIKPINSEGIDRWKKYASYFDDRWALLDDEPK